jgi:hypothetical protein
VKEPLATNGESPEPLRCTARACRWREQQRAARAQSSPGLWQRPASLRGRAPVAANRGVILLPMLRALPQHDLARSRERALARIRFPRPAQSAASPAIGRREGGVFYFASSAAVDRPQCPLSRLPASCAAGSSHRSPLTGPGSSRKLERRLNNIGMSPIGTFRRCRLLR